MKIGAHVSTAGGASKAIDRAVDIGAESIQIFASSPRSWAFKPPKDEEVIAFRERSEAAGIGPAFIHGSYLVNLGGPAELLEKSIDSLTKNMNAAGQLGVQGVIFHTGSHKGKGFQAILDQATGVLSTVLENSPPDVWLMIENSAGAGDHIGSKFAEIGSMIEKVDSDRLRVCLDTQHTFGAGYDISDPNEIDSVMSEFDNAIGLHRLGAVHANDSKVAFGSGVDRHENIGEGNIGIEGFKTIMRHPAFADVPFLLEVPGADKKGPDKENVDRLKAIRTEFDI
jgi:deoxyribonuclease-4